MGDLNSRVGTLQNNNTIYKYTDNPDHVINENGRKMISWIDNHKDIIVLNELYADNFKFDSKFTYSKGERCSQNDFAMVYSIEGIISFIIIEKTIYSDHWPLSISYDVCIEVSLNLIEDCSKGLLDYEHLDINKRKLPSINPFRVDWLKAIPALEKASIDIKEMVRDAYVSNDVLDSHITNTI